MGNSISSLNLQEDTFWEIAAKTRWGSYLSDIEQQVILKASHLAKGGLSNVALEIGCEGGRWSKMLADQGWSLVCTDVNPEYLEICQQKIPLARCILVEQDSQTIPYETSGVGLLLCIEVAPVINNDWFIDEAFRVLTPGGFAVGVFWNKLSYKALLHNLTRSSQSINYYATAYTKWRNKLHKQGFKLISETGFSWAPFTRESNSFLIPIFTYLERMLGLRHLPSLSPWVIFIAQKDGAAK